MSLPPKARLDADGTAKPRTRLVAQVQEGQRVGFYGTPATHIELEGGERIALGVEYVDPRPVYSDVKVYVNGVELKELVLDSRPVVATMKDNGAADTAVGVVLGLGRVRGPFDPE